jgi:P2-related tail formation protein
LTVYCTKDGMDWLQTSTYPVQWARPVPIVGVVYVTKSTVGALMRTLETFQHPIIIVYWGRVRPDTLMDSFLLS